MKIGIVGGGIVGVNTGLVLLEAGHEVVIYAREVLEGTTSWAAAAVAYPVNIEETPRCLDWYRASLGRLDELAGDVSSGVSIVKWAKYSEHANLTRLFWMDCVESARILGAADCPDNYQSGVAANLHLMDVDVYYPYMIERFKAAGGRFEMGEIGAVEDLSRGCDVVVNCTGIGAHGFVWDEGVYPARGQVVIVKNPGIDRWFSLFESKNYLYSRPDTCLIGGSYDVDDWNVAADDAVTDEILAWAQSVEPALVDVEIVDVRVGLRPLRSGVRLEQEVLPSGLSVIHNYGHGGCGYTLSWGCAESVLKLVESL